MPRKLPFYVYSTTISYEKWIENLHFSEDFANYVKKHNIDGIIFGNMYQVN